MFEIEYYKDNNLIKTKSSNNDIEINIIEDLNQYQLILKAKTKITLEKTYILNYYKIDNKNQYFFNGYQAWTDTHLTDIKFKEKDILKMPKVITNSFSLNDYGDAKFYNYNKNKLHGYDIFYSSNKDIFIYNLNYKNAYLIFEVLKKEKVLNLISDIKNKSLKENEEFTIFNFKKFNDFELGINSFNNDFKLENKNKLLGYTSWYNYYQNINEDIILNDLSNLDERFDLFQIDDGYETFVGDWQNVDKTKFKDGLLKVVNEIHKKGFKAGIWLAPFVAEEKSNVFINHNDWIKRYSDGSLVKAGGNWSGFYSLDLEKEEVINYIKDCLKYVKDFGFDFFKLDFIYAASIVPFKGKTRAMTQRETYQFLKDQLKDKLILGCGNNLFSSYGLFDYSRIGPDVSLKFDDVWYMKYLHRERISTKVTLQNTILRSIFNNHLFLNDSDVFLLRDENIELKEEQRLALITINSLFSSLLMTSDDIGKYDDKKKEILTSTINIFNNAKNQKFKVFKDKYYIEYELDNKKINLTYNAKKGVFE